MSRHKADPVAEAFRRWIALSTDQQARLTDMMAGYNASVKLYETPPAPRTKRERTPKVATNDRLRNYELPHAEPS